MKVHTEEFTRQQQTQGVPSSTENMATTTTTTTIPLSAANPVVVQAPSQQEYPPTERRISENEMQAVVLIRHVGRFKDEKNLQSAFEIRTLPKPAQLGFNDVLIRVARAQIDPSDTSFIQNRYGAEAIVPCIPGFEGAGRIQATGSNPMIWRLKGKKVSFFSERGGAWADYVVVDYSRVIELPESTPWEDAASAFLNPITALEMLHLSNNERCVVVTAGASQTMKQFIRVAKSHDLNTIAITRDHGECQECERCGAFITLNSEDKDFETQLKQAIDRNGVRVAFDAVAGRIGSSVFRALPKNGQFHVLGFMSNQELAIDPAELIFKNKKIHGVWITEMLKEKSGWQLSNMKRVVAAELEADLKTDVSGSYPLADVARAIDAYTANQCEGKVHLVCNQGTIHEV
jgi:NADPH:quinone reductase-like Zn-dependent oxidoreductase